jgi:hypothetical protein
MRPVACAVVTFVVACSHPGGLELQVQPLPGVSSARVYLGTTQVQNVSSLTVPFDQTEVVATTSTDQVFVRDFDNDLDVATFDDGHPLDFEFTTTSSISLGAILVVGYDANGMPAATDLLTGISATSDQLLQFDVVLSPIDQSEQLFLWGSDRTAPLTDAECAGLVTTTNTAFIVAQSDTDCDGFLNHDPDECDPHYWNRTIPLVADGACVDYGSGSACMLGGDGECVDGIGSSASMTCSIDGSTICVPTEDCRCRGSGADTLGCLLQAGGGLGYTCSSGTNVPGCPITLPVAPTGGMTCEPPATSMSGLALAGDTTFTQQVDLGSGVMLSLDVGSACNVTLTATGSVSNMMPIGASLLMRLDLTNGNSFVAPIALTLTSDACSPPGQGTCSQSALVGDTSLTTCLAGWGSAHDTGLVGLSPTLTPTMDEMLFIAAGSATSGSGEVVRSLFTNNGWSTPPDEVMYDVPPTNAPKAVHLQDPLTLWVVDAQGIISKYTRATTGALTWKRALAVPPSAFPEQVTAYAPDSGGSDAILATSSNGLYELSGDTLANTLAGGSAVFGTPITSGQTPFMTDDDLTIWYAGGPLGGNTAIYTLSRPTRNDVFPQSGIELAELGASKVLQSPWVSQLPTSYLTTMYYAFEDPSSPDNTPHIVYVTRP